MATLSPERIADLLVEYYPSPSAELVDALSIYLDLLLKWNARTNLTAIRDPAEIVQRHFGESLFTARHLPGGESLLDIGSGAGFPGLPIQLVLPHLKVTLAESQHKKASFLREVVRTLGLSTEIWGDRVEAMPSVRRFDLVTLRAVDNPVMALRLAQDRVDPGGTIAHLTSSGGTDAEAIPIPGSSQTVLRLIR
jgi:16S rRNA (guanine527-N7)-methyltransferase